MRFENPLLLGRGFDISQSGIFLALLSTFGGLSDLTQIVLLVIVGVGSQIGIDLFAVCRMSIFDLAAISYAYRCL
jgi:hypothetical protein